MSGCKHSPYISWKDKSSSGYDNINMCFLIINKQNCRQSLNIMSDGW
jgi:hypothetical protein